MSVLAWWAGKTHRVRVHLTARVSLAERAGLATLLSPRELALFDSLHVADRRHGIVVRDALLAAGERDPDLLVAALLHDAGKGPRTGLAPRIAWALGERHGTAIHAVALRIPGLRGGVARMRDHVVVSARLAAEAGARPRVVALIAAQSAPEEPAARALHLADEAAG
ncbi:MAG: HD domain-containing protein [Chloroflexota bacterium]